MGTGTICLSSASLYQAMANQTVSQTGTALSNAYYNSTTGEIWVEHTQYLALAQNRATVYHARTETERLCAEQAQQAARAHQEQWMEKQRIALARSRELLLAHLSPAQRATFEENRFFVVQGGMTKSKYRIRTENYAGNIDVLSGSKVRHRLCCHCDGVPLHDQHLAQKLSLEHDEERFLQIANRQAA